MNLLQRIRWLHLWFLLGLLITASFYSDESDGGGHKAKRCGGEKSDLVWIQVKRSDLKAS